MYSLHDSMRLHKNVSDEEYDKNWEEHINFRFNCDFEDDGLGGI